jgi:glutamate synthase domain-containing protein 3
MKFSLVVATALLSANVAAQSTSIYGPNGQYMGQTFQSGNVTSFYGPTGQYQGQAFQSGNVTSLYGSSGQYMGQTFSNSVPTITPLPMLPATPSLTPQFDSIFGR